MALNNNQSITRRIRNLQSTKAIIFHEANINCGHEVLACFPNPTKICFLEELQRKPENNVLKFYNYFVNDGNQINLYQLFQYSTVFNTV